MDLKTIYQGVITEHDPLIPFESGFKNSLDWLNRSEQNDDKQRIIFRTRSPLVILLAPVMNRFKDRIKIIIPIEAITDQLHQVLDKTSALPRPSERLSAARALYNLGFQVEIELRPFIGDLQASSGLLRVAIRGFSSVCDNAASKIFLREPLAISHQSGRAGLLIRRELETHLMADKLSLESDRTRYAA